MERLESSPLFFLEMESGEDSPHSIRFAISVTISNIKPVDSRKSRH